jgi:alpha-beta hydrolase superfamily lysophospholipase
MASDEFVVKRLIAALCFLALGACVPAGPPPLFYTAPVTDSRAPHGALIRSEVIRGAPSGSRAYRIVYQSSARDGRPIPVSGMVIVPDAPAPAAGRPVIAWAHPTTGVQPRCAPSLSPLRFMMIPGVSEMVKRGFVVAATDYPGLGTGTDHPFLDGPSEGRAVLDSVRAAAAVPGASANLRFALWGHSQGGQAVLFAADMRGRYAPELQLAGVAAAAPATELATLFRNDAGTTAGNNLSSLTLYAWARIYGASYAHVVTPRAIPAIKAVAKTCWDTLFEGAAERSADKVLATSFFTVPDITKVEPWGSLSARNSAPVLPRDIRVFLAQGDADVLVHPAVTYNYMARLCASGSRVALDVVPKVGHDWIGMKSAEAAVAWMGDRLRGLPAPDDCLAPKWR